ncbi:MAG: alpha-galactosidase, partial [Thermus sp.]
MRLRFSLGEVAVEVEGVGKTPGGFRLLGKEVRVYAPSPARFFFRHGWQSWSLASWVDLAEPLKPLLPLKRRPQADDPWLLSQKAHWGSGLGALRVGEGVLLLGALGPGARV